MNRHSLIVEPISRARKPSLPTKDEFDAQDRLADHLPNRWKLNATVLAATLVAAVPSAWGQESRPLPGEVAPVRYMDESEAVSIIKQEARKYGVKFEKTKKRVSFPLGGSYAEPKDRKGKRVTITLDGEDTKHGISFEFVSRDDQLALGASPEQIAKALKQELKKTGKGAKVGVFEIGQIGGDVMKEAKLRKQVRTFLESLKSQGII